MATLRSHPHLYEINTWPWLDELSRRHGRHLTLAGVPDEHWDVLRARGIDLVYLMGVWRRSSIGRERARSDFRLFAAYDQALPGWRARDVAGSAYSVMEYRPDPRIGQWKDLDQVREKLHARGMRLIVDFIPNHTGFDHVWMSEHPERFVNVSEETFRRDPSACRAIEDASGNVRLIACGRDPFFPPWTDVAQLDYFNGHTRAAMIAQLEAIAQHADGARCDMAMLALSDVFQGTWSEFVKTPAPATEFWAEARAAVPGFLLLAEVYWDLEWRLQQLGFDFTYDKRLYDRLLDASARDVRDHLRADDVFQSRLARFIENHDEPPSLTVFGERTTAAAVTISTLQGLRFYHDGQFEGSRAHLPVQLGTRPDEPIDNRIDAFYRRLLEIVDAPVFHAGEWRLLDVGPDGDETFANIVAWRWKGGGRLAVVVVNLGRGHAHGHVQLSEELPSEGQAFVFEDQLDGKGYTWSRNDLSSSGGLYVRLDVGQSHIFSVAPAET